MYIISVFYIVFEMVVVFPLFGITLSTIAGKFFIIYTKEGALIRQLFLGIDNF